MISLMNLTVNMTIEVYKSTQWLKSNLLSVSQRGKFSGNIKMNDFVGNIHQNKVYACCYILLSGTRPKLRCTPICGAAMLRISGATGAETSLLLTAYCIESLLAYPRCRWALNS